MKHLALAALTLMFAAFQAPRALATPLDQTILAVCLSQDARLDLYFGPGNSFDYIYIKGEEQKTFHAEAHGWGQGLSAVSQDGYGTDAVALKAQIIAGTPDQPIIEASSQAVFARDAEGQYRLKSGYAFYQSVEYPFAEFIGSACYVQQ